MNTEEATDSVTAQVTDRANELLHETDNYIRDNPFPTVLTAFGIGFALGIATRLFDAPERRRDTVHDAIEDLRAVLSSGAKRGKRAYADSAEAVRDAVEHAVEKARDLDIDPVASWWKRLWS